MTPRGVVLAGGRSSRMGTDKSLLVLDGTPLAVRVATALADGGCDPVVCQGGDVAALGALGLLVLPDSTGGSGPLPAIADALTAADPSDIVVTACDLAWLQADTVASLLRAAAVRPAVDVVAATDADGPHLISFWRASAGARLRNQLELGVVSYRGVLRALGALLVEVDPESVRNVNRPEDLP